MKIAVALTDQSFTRTKSMGIFNVSMGLTYGLMQHPDVTELHILGNDECAAAFADCPPHVHLHLMDKPVPRRFGRVWWDQFGLPAAVRRISPDWLLLPKGFPPIFPCLGKTKIACYVHDVIWEYYAELGKLGQNPFPWYENIYFTHLGKHALKCADLVLTSTRFNADRFRFHVPTVNAAVVGIGFDIREQTPPRPLSRHKGILFFASTFPHKLTATGIGRLKSWLKQRQDSKDISIHIIGSLPSEVELPSPNWIKHGRISQHKLTELMLRECRTSVYFSAYEGFGMPPVESLRAGLPCVCSDIPPIRENIPAKYLFCNEDEQNFIHIMNQTFDSVTAPSSPDFSTWAEVTHSCVQAMKKA